MKKLILVMIILLSTVALEAGQSKHKNPKHYILDDEIFLYTHGMYIAYPGKLYRIKTLYKSKTMGYYTYKSKMKRIPLEDMQKYPWTMWDGALQVQSDD